MVAAKLDHSRVFVTNFHQNWSTLKARNAGQRHTDRQTSRLVYGPIAPPIPNAPSLDVRNDADATFVDPHICRRLPLHDAATPLVLLLHATIGGRLPEW